MDKKKAKADLPIKIKDGNPIILIVTDQKMSKDLIEGLEILDLNVVLVSDHMDFYEKLLWASDFMLVLHDKPEKYLNDAWHNGVIPIVSSNTPGVLNYNPNKETGNSFTFDHENQWEIFAACVRASETFKFPYDWKHLVTQAQEMMA